MVMWYDHENTRRGWGRRSKKRPKRKSPTRSTPAAENVPPTVLSAQTTTTHETDCQNDVLCPSRGDINCRQPPDNTNISVLEQSHPPQSYPRTLVNGVYYVHDPNSLPQPLGQGYLAWATLEREAARQSSPRHPGEARWNNRTLRFWHLCTDFSRFRVDGEHENYLEPNGTGVERNHGIGNVNGSRDNNPLLMSGYRDMTLQRPYTAPPHQL